MHVPFSREWCRVTAHEIERLREVANRICRCGRCGRERVNCTTESGCPYCLASSLTARLAEAEALLREAVIGIDGPRFAAWLQETRTLLGITAGELVRAVYEANKSALEGKP